MRSVVVLTFLLAAAASAADLPLQPCSSIFEYEPWQLELQARLNQQLQFDRVPYDTGGRPILRIVIEPDWGVGSSAPPGETAVSVYLPSSGDAVVEIARARGSIKGANSRHRRVGFRSPTYSTVTSRRRVVIPVDFARARLPRELAVALARQALPGAFGEDDSSLRIHPHAYTILSWDSEGSAHCAAASLHSSEFEATWLGEVTMTLSRLALAQMDAPAAEERLVELSQRMMVSPLR